MKEKLELNQIKLNPKNPRWIRDDKFRTLVQSIKDFPEMLETRPIVIDENGVVLGGNMRLKACKEAGLKEVPIIRFQGSEKEKKEFLIKDNASFGEWDYNLLNDDFSTLEGWGMSLPSWITEGLGEEYAATEIPDELFNDEDMNWLKSEPQNSEYEEMEKRSSWEGTYVLLQYELEDYEFIKKVEPLVVKLTGTENISDAVFMLVAEEKKRLSND